MIRVWINNEYHDVELTYDASTLEWSANYAGERMGYGMAHTFEDAVKELVKENP